jgi:RND family efflux transporter MFP subunit
MRNYAMVLVAGFAVLLVACDSKQQASAAPPAVAASPASARTPAPATPAEYVASGPLVVEQQVDVAAQRTGIVVKLMAEVGSRVHKGQVLAELDNRQLLAERDAADAKVKSTQFELQHWQAEVKVRDSDRSRDEEMFKASLITAKQLEHSQYAVEGAKFETQREVQNLRTAQETLKALDLELEKTRILSPFDGVVARRYIREGQKVAPSDRMFWITAMSPIEVKFTLPQEFAGKVQRGQEITVASQANPDRRQVARITLISPVVDPSSGTIEVAAQLVGAPADMLPGMTVNIRVPKQ